jgi:hypothetical protein
MEFKLRGDDMTAVWNVFNGAVRILVGAGPVKQRLIDAWRAHLAPLHDKDVPDALRSRLTAVRAAMHVATRTIALADGRVVNGYEAAHA